MSTPVKIILDKNPSNIRVLTLLEAIEDLPKFEDAFFRNTLFKSRRILMKEGEEVKAFRKEVMTPLQKAQEDLVLKYVSRTEKGSPKKTTLPDGKAQYLIDDDVDKEYQEARIDLEAKQAPQMEELKAFLNQDSGITFLYGAYLDQIPETVDEQACGSIHELIFDDEVEKSSEPVPAADAE